MYKKFKIAASDFDGTLLRSDDTISPFTVAVLKEFIEAGGLFIIATGRMFDGVHNRLRDAGLDVYDMPLIAYNGSLARMSKSGAELFRAQIERGLAAETLAFAESLGLYTQIYVSGRIKVGRETEFSSGYANYMRVPFDVTGKLSEYVLTAPEPPEKILCVLEHGDARNTLKLFERKFGGRVKLISSVWNFVEIIPLNSGKDCALERVLAGLGRGLDDAMVFGDNLNDIDMITRAGLGIAVANAEPETLAAARYVTASNNEDGVAKAIKKFGDFTKKP
jgi:Cof subfamily protein (haloacid dehalogenase superfamily)